MKIHPNKEPNTMPAIVCGGNPEDELPYNDEDPTVFGEAVAVKLEDGESEEDTDIDGDTDELIEGEAEFGQAAQVLLSPIYVALVIALQSGCTRDKHPPAGSQHAPAQPLGTTRG